MKIAIDIDDVIVCFAKEFMDFVANKGFKRVKYEDIYCYRLWDVLNIDKEVFLELLKEFNFIDHFDKMVFIEGSRDGINFLKNKHNIYFITSRPGYISKKTRDFVFEEFGILGNRVFFSGDVVGSGKRKDEICRELDIGLIIEDSELASLGYAEKGLRVLLLDKPWNKKIKHKNINRCFSWDDILVKIKEIKYE